MRILACIESFLPGTSGGGPVRALANLIDWVEDFSDVRVLTRNRDYLQPAPYRDVVPDFWIQKPGCEVYYASEENWLAPFLQCVKEWRPDAVYLNGAFAPMTRRILSQAGRELRRAGILILVAPHGNFGPATLQHHRWRKKAWLCYARLSGLYQGVAWHAGSEREAGQIERLFGSNCDIRIVPMAPSKEIGSEQIRSKESHSDLSAEPADLRLVYFGRLTREKNLSFALDRLGNFARSKPTSNISYDLIYLGQMIPALEAQVKKLPENVQVNFVSNLSHEALRRRLAHPPQGQYDAMLMPSHTENFSYTVLESLQAGIPPLISDQTPWRGLEAEGIGWDLPLDEKHRWLDALQSLSTEPDAARESRRKRALAYARDWSSTYQSQAQRLFSMS